MESGQAGTLAHTSTEQQPHHISHTQIQKGSPPTARLLLLCEWMRSPTQKRPTPINSHSTGEMFYSHIFFVRRGVGRQGRHHKFKSHLQESCEEAALSLIRIAPQPSSSISILSPPFAAPAPNLTLHWLQWQDCTSPPHYLSRYVSSPSSSPSRGLLLPCQQQRTGGKWTQH